MTPQQLGALIKRTGIRKSARRKGRMYSYNTEGYRLERQYPGNRYTLDYRGETTLAPRSDWERERIAGRERELFDKVTAILLEKGIACEEREGSLWITLPVEEKVSA